MKRYPSIDFLRGLAIFLMVYLHTLMRWFDRTSFENAMETSGVPLSLVYLLIISLFLGSWCGFFLMVSAMGNMISMYKGLEKGQKPKGLIYRQIVGGIILLLFAYLTEGVLGYHGTLGELALGQPWNTSIQYSFWRIYHMETIHTIAWCIILNGIVQGLLSMNGGWKKISRNIKIYAILAVAVVAVTVFVWFGFNQMVNGNWIQDPGPSGYGWQYGNLANPNLWWFNITRVFLQPWASQVEPVFPFLAVSFIGSIISLAIVKRAQEPKSSDTSVIKKGIAIGTILTFAGLIMVLLMIFTSGRDPLDYTLSLLSIGYSIPQAAYVAPVTFLGFNMVWLPYFILLTGTQIAAICLIIRLVEFRGKGKNFAGKTLFVRRFGFVAFSIYNYQFIDVLAVLLLFTIPIFPGMSNGIPYTSMSNTFNDWQIWFVLILVYLIWYVVLALWEKVDYALGFEWCIAKISYFLIPSKRSPGESKLPWWKTSRLDPKASLHNAEWINIIDEEQIDHNNLRESKLSQKLALCGIIFFPCFFLAMSISKSSKKTEGKNKYNSRGMIIGIIGAILFIAFIVGSTFLSTSLLF